MSHDKMVTLASRIHSAVSRQKKKSTSRANRNPGSGFESSTVSLSKEQIERYAPPPISSLIERRSTSKLLSSVALQERIHHQNQEAEPEKRTHRKFYKGINPHIAYHK